MEFSKSCLDIKHSTDRHTNELILNEFLEIVKHYRIESSVYKIVTGSGSNMVKAFNEEHIDLFVSYLNEILDGTCFLVLNVKNS